jgi:hypothetical protein
MSGSEAPLISQLTPRQLTAIGALLSAETQEGAARAAGVSPRTLRRWQDEPAFIGELSRQRARVIGAVATALAGRAVACADALGLTGASTSRRRADPAKVAAARATLDLFTAFVESSDIVSRLEALEIAAAKPREQKTN